MKRNHKDLILLLNAALQQKKYDCSHFSIKRLEALYHIACLHHLEPLIFTSLSPKKLLNEKAPLLMTEWENNFLITSLKQHHYFIEAERLIQLFNEQQIFLMPLKGIYLRQLYPMPDLRTMSDLDFYIHPEDMSQVQAILYANGYEEVPDQHSYHTRFIQKNKPKLEIHWALTNHQIFHIPDVIRFEQEIYDHACLLKIGSVTTSCAMSLNDQLCYMCLHMAKHFKFQGFGLRTLCDFYLFIKTYAQSLDFAAIEKSLSKMGLHVFFNMALTACNQLFDPPLQLPELNTSMLTPKACHTFIEEVFFSGKSGAALYYHGVSSMMLHSSQKNSDLPSHITQLIFPPLTKLFKQYPYCSRFKILIPTAYLAHLGFLLCRRDIPLTAKLQTLFLSRHNQKKRQQLFNLLKL